MPTSARERRTARLPSSSRAARSRSARRYVASSSPSPPERDERRSKGRLADLRNDLAGDDLLSDLTHRRPLVHCRLLNVRERVRFAHRLVVHQLALRTVDPATSRQLLL